MLEVKEAAEREKERERQGERQRDTEMGARQIFSSILGTWFINPQRWHFIVRPICQAYRLRVWCLGLPKPADPQG